MRMKRLNGGVPKAKLRMKLLVDDELRESEIRVSRERYASLSLHGRQVMALVASGLLN